MCGVALEFGSARHRIGTALSVTACRRDSSPKGRAKGASRRYGKFQFIGKNAHAILITNFPDEIFVWEICYQEYYSVVWDSFPKWSSFMPSTSSQMGFRLQEPQSVGMPSRILDRVSVMFFVLFASACRPL